MGTKGPCPPSEEGHVLLLAPGEGKQHEQGAGQEVQTGSGSSMLRMGPVHGSNRKFPKETDGGTAPRRLGQLAQKHRWGNAWGSQPLFQLKQPAPSRRFLSLSQRHGRTEREAYKLRTSLSPKAALCDQGSSPLPSLPRPTSFLAQQAAQV